MAALRATGGTLRTLWARLHALPGGRTLFSMLLGWLVPYTATVRPRILELRPGYARVAMRDRRRVRNHLASVHAIALANLAEAASGLATVTGLPDDARGILTGFEMDFVKKARGPLVAECASGVPDASVDREWMATVEVRDGAGDVVARGRARWLVGPHPSRRDR